MKRLSTLVSILAVVIPLTSALAQDSSPYVVGDWRINDTAAAVTTVNTEFIFVNPTDLTLTLEYAFFAPDGTFCGCDRDTLMPNGRTRYTMADEVSGGQFSTTLCPSQTEGELKSIVFVSEGKKGIVLGDAAQGGIQIHFFGNPVDKAESNLQGIAINKTTTREINGIHQQCKKFIH